MNKKFARLSVTILLVSLLALFAGGVNQAMAASITPIFVAGNPTCTSLGYDFGFKVDPPNSGTYSIDGVNTVTVTTDGVNFDWTSTLGMDAVISKGGPNANVYIYDPPTESFGDTGLHSPINPNNGNPFGLSHIEFCFDYELDVEKTAETSFTRTFSWTIDKSVTPDTLNMFTGDSGTVQYTVTVTKSTGVDSDWAVNGTILIENNTPLNATITGVSDQISGDGSPTPDCGVTFPYSLAAGDTLECSYSSSLPDGTNRTNTATVTTTGAVNGDTATAAVTFGNPTTVVHDSITVMDSVGGDLGSFNTSGSTSYSRTFTCDSDEGLHNNTATINETGQSDTASVTVNCYELTITKDASTSFTRKWNWTINKMGDQSQLTLSTGQSFLVNYQVIVSATFTDINHAVSGSISVNNPAPIAATLNSVSDVLTGGISATVDCGVTFPYTLAASETLSCTYSASLPNADNRTNTATATLQNTPSGTTDFTGSASVSFANATVAQEDECVTVTDDKGGSLGSVCANESPKTFNYSLTVGPYATCGEYTYVNTATFTTNDTGATGSESHTVNVNVPCAGGCTLTQGYWKTHSLRGPAPYDDAWLNIGPAGADTTFFLSGKTYYQVLWTPPAGNVYYNLAHQYIAAKLNLLNGASSTPAVDAAITFAANFFATKTPSSPLTRAERNAVLAAASTLDQYNNGLIGPGHCSE